jgi:hypothetical protein
MPARQGDHAISLNPRKLPDHRAGDAMGLARYRESDVTRFQRVGPEIGRAGEGAGENRSSRP